MTIGTEFRKKHNLKDRSEAKLRKTFWLVSWDQSLTASYFFRLRHFTARRSGICTFKNARTNYYLPHCPISSTICKNLMSNDILGRCCFFFAQFKKSALSTTWKRRTSQMSQQLPFLTVYTILWGRYNASLDRMKKLSRIRFQYKIFLLVRDVKKFISSKFLRHFSM